MEKSKFIDLLEDLPPVIANTEIVKQLGGVISDKTLSNLVALGKGPEGRMKVGKKVVWKTRPLLEWLDSRNRA